MDETCSVCLERVEGLGAYKIDSCSHVFHSSCLIEWMRRGNLSCPTCRNDLAERHIAPQHILTRARYLRCTVARRATAPPELKLLVRGLRTAEQTAGASAREEKRFREDHSELLKQHRQKIRKVWRDRRGVYRRMVLLGLYQDANLRLPPLAFSEANL